MIKPIASEHTELADDFERMCAGELASPEYLRIVRGAVDRAFFRAQLMPIPEYCEADVDDVCQEVTYNLMVFFKKNDCRPEGDPEQKVRYMRRMTFRFAKFGVALFYQLRWYGRPVKKHKRLTCPVFVYRDHEAMSRLPQNETIQHDWESFVDAIELRLSPSRAAACLAFAFTDGTREASEVLGVSYDTMRSHQKRLRKVLRNDPDDLLGGLEPRVCRQCGERLHGKAYQKFCSTRCWELFQRQKQARSKNRSQTMEVAA